MAKLDTQRYRINPIAIRLTEGDSGEIHIPNKVQLFRTGTYRKTQPDGSPLIFEITKETLAEIVQNFKDKARGIDINIDFSHKSDEEAAAWMKDLILENNGTELWAEVEWTPDGLAALGAKKFRYLSPDFAFSYTDNESGKKFGATLFGAGLTNRPVIKNMAPAVELTEVEEIEMDPKELEILKAKAAKVDQLEADKKPLELKLAEKEDDAPPKKKDAKDMNLEEMQEAYGKLSASHQAVCDELAEMKKSQAKLLAEAAEKKKEADFNILLSEGKVVAAQKDPFMKGDMATFAKLQQPVKIKTLGSGETVTAQETSAQDEVLQLAEELVKTGKVKTKRDAVNTVLRENPKLEARYEKEMNPSDAH